MAKSPNTGDITLRSSLWVGACVFGNEMLPLLATFLESWSNFSDRVAICYAELPADDVEALRVTYPNVDFLLFDTRLRREREARIGQKMQFWAELSRYFNSLLERCDYTIFADIDTIAIRSPQEMLCSDVVLTLRSDDSQFLLNSGVVALSDRALSSLFCEEWAATTTAVYASPSELRRSLDQSRIFGGPGQMALINMLGISREHLPSVWHQLSIAYVPCSVFNACENQIDVEVAKVLHLKSSMQDFLLRRKPFIGDRNSNQAAPAIQIARSVSSLARWRIRTAGFDTRKFEFRLPFGSRADCSVPRFFIEVARLKSLLRQYFLRLQGLPRILWEKSTVDGLPRYQHFSILDKDCVAESIESEERKS